MLSSHQTGRISRELAPGEAAEATALPKRVASFLAESAIGSSRGPETARESMTERAGLLDASVEASGGTPGMSAEATAVALSNLAAIGAALAAQFRPSEGEMSLGPHPALAPDAPAPPAWSPNDLLTVSEASAALRVSPRWLYRHAKDLPFARKLSRKVLRFSRAGITRWLTTKRP